eukprot:CAMPEP_0118711880 /NCGR_PEP_ID=MMETSP0800-20121206/24403_1 /TAXON_ID=210618 ORGANISM="Striatella unipunctata, Strain CCMP2910" /NCGR_SAMPLE_ID=MMETSP0800 /ASSEMBLY_ACC=CAM_ASM_000638 /LENGTH=75 /DNA_ID=CAMNT_0006616663 /DNA_START=46 /DNA_END=273 /DNA_ORIENTATION=+
MELRQQIQILLIIFFTFVAFASYSEGTGSTMWLQWTTLVTFIFFGLVFDMAFTDESSFIFDPDADNWRRKTEVGY